MSTEAPGLSEAAAAAASAEAMRGGLRRAAFAADRLIGRCVELIGAVLVLAETCILFAGVVSRYVFNSPMLWTDELATFLFLWLAMVGAVVALRRDGHMRLTTFANWVGPEWGGWLGTIAELVGHRLCPRNHWCRRSNTSRSSARSS